MAKLTTPAFDAVNAQNVKLPVIVLQIEGLPFIFASAQTYTKIRYDDPGVFYNGEFVYDGLRPLPSSGPGAAHNYIDRDSSRSTISQKLEQWDGRANIETLSLKLIDKDGELTKICTPGQFLPDILNNKVRVFFGYQNISYPEDFIRLFSGYINDYTLGQGYVIFKLTDPGSKRKQDIFSPAQTTLSLDIDNAQTTITLQSNTLLPTTILDGNGIADPTVTLGIVIDNEIITYNNASINVDGVTLNGVVRGAFGTVADAHTATTAVDTFISLSDNPINIALKAMLSGWNGPCFKNVPLRGIVNTDDGHSIPDSITFAQGVDLNRDYGIVVGDFIVLSGSPNTPNNATFQIVQLVNDNRTAIVTPTGVLVQENPPGAGSLVTVAGLRSQYDTYPVTAGLSLTTDEVNVTTHQYLRDTFIQFDFVMQTKSSEDSAKDWIETHLMKPIGAYSLTQGSRISMGLTHPPLTTDLSKILNHTNIVDAKDITVNRSLTDRFFYNEVIFNYAYDPVQQTFNKSFIVEDAGSQDRLQQVSTLSIDVRGLPDNPNSVTIMQQRAERILLRYRYAAETISVKTNFAVGNTIDGGDIVVLDDKTINNTPAPLLQISNTEVGQRGVFGRIMEVQERSILLTEAKTQLKLLSNLGFSTTDRYAVIAPSSLVAFGVDTQHFQIKESFGGRFPGQEYKKWQNYQSLLVRVHSPDFSRDGVAAFQLDPNNPFNFIMLSALPFTPLANDIVDFAPYQENTAINQSAIKNRYVSLNRTGDVASGSSATVFTLQAGQGAGYIPGNVIYVMSPDGTTRFSEEFAILTAVGDQITIRQIINGVGPVDLGFIPQAGDFMKLGGFKDGGQSYRYI